MGEFWDPAALFFCLRYKMIKNRHIKYEILTSLGFQRIFFPLRIQSGICRNYFMEKEMNMYFFNGMCYTSDVLCVVRKHSEKYN